MVLFSSVDPVYFNRFIPALAESAHRNGQALHVNVVNPSSTVERLAAVLSSCYCRFTASYTYDDTYELSPEEKRTYYASHRFLMAPHLMLETGADLVIVDADSLVNRNLDTKFLSEYDFGLFLRDSLPGTIGWENLGTKVAAGMVYYSGPRGQHIATSVSKRIVGYGLRWFVDQVSLREEYEAMSDRSRFFQFTREHLDWEFTESSWIWTGKGDRKYNSDEYVKKYNHYQGQALVRIANP